MKWQKKQVSIYSTHNDRAGTVRTLGEILFSDFANNINHIVRLRNLERTAPNYELKKKAIKNELQCFALNELTNRKEVVNYSGMIQIDFDKKDCEGYDIEELKQAVFSLPFIAFVSLSCSGDGFYALAAIAEPERQREYAEHIFNVLDSYGLSCDTSKGRNYNDLRYVSYDVNLMDKEDVEPLRISQFKPKLKPIQTVKHSVQHNTFAGNNQPLINAQANTILNAQIGQRWQTVQKAAFTLGGKGEGLEQLEQAILSNSAFAGQESHYLKCAADCYRAGQLKPMK